MSDQQKEMMTVRQWSIIKNIPYSTLRRATQRGELPTTRYVERGYVYVHQDDIEAFIEKAKTRAQTEASDV